MRVLTFTIIKAENDPALKDYWIARCKENFLLIFENISITAGNPTYRWKRLRNCRVWDCTLALIFVSLLWKYTNIDLKIHRIFKLITCELFIFLYMKPESKTSLLGFRRNFVNFTRKELCTKFCCVLISFQEVEKLQSFEFGVSDVIPANIENVLTLVFFAYFCWF